VGFTQWVVVRTGRAVIDVRGIRSARDIMHIRDFS
jgi:hypothetical protein